MIYITMQNRHMAYHSAKQHINISQCFTWLFNCLCNC